jgi:hypothetical protein
MPPTSTYFSLLNGTLSLLEFHDVHSLGKNQASNGLRRFHCPSAAMLAISSAKTPKNKVIT